MGKGTHDNKGGDRLVYPSALLQKVPDDDASAEQSDEDVDGHDGRMVRRRRQRAQAREVMRDQAQRHGRWPSSSLSPKPDTERGSKARQRSSKIAAGNHVS